MQKTDAFATPIFVICRDKLNQLQRLLSWLESNGYSRVYLVDNASTYPPLLDFLESTSLPVVRHAENRGPHRAIWGSGVIEKYAHGEFYAVTDSDVLPDPGCPSDAMSYFRYCLDRYPDYIKAGFALRIDDLPTHYLLADEVKAWERAFWARRLEAGLYHAVIDTTFALYRPGSSFEYAPSIRTGRPYWARHLPWYSDTLNPTSEEVYYREHAAQGVAHWDLDGQNNWALPPGMSIRERAMWPLHSRLRVRRNNTASWPR